MSRLLFWAAILILALVAAAFAASNREAVVLGLWPLPFLLQAPLYLVALGGLLLGFVAGALVAWIAGGERRRRLRECRRRITLLERELVATQGQIGGVATGTALTPSTAMPISDR